MKMYDNPFIVPTTIGYRDHWRNGISSERQIDQTKRWMGTRAAPQTALWIEVGELLKGKLVSTELWLVQKATDEGPLKRSSHRSVQYDSSTDKANTISCRV
jgi:hypothetical protein